LTTYKYKGVSPDGARVSGVIKAYDEFEAVSQLRETCSVVTKIEAVPEQKEGSVSFGSHRIKAKELAIQQYEQGCLFINDAAAAGGDGVFEAAKEKGFYTSGQDADQTDANNPYIVSTQLKDTYQTLLNVVDEFFSGNWTNDTAVWGVAEGAIGAVYVTHESENPRSERLSDEDIAQLQQIAEDLRTGALDLKEYPTEEEYLAG